MSVGVFHPWNWPRVGVFHPNLGVWNRGVSSWKTPPDHRGFVENALIGSQKQLRLGYQGPGSLSRFLKLLGSVSWAGKGYSAS